MSDLQTVKTILNSYNEFDVAGTKKYQLETEAGKFDLWMTKRDGNQTKAYQNFCGLGELGCQVEIGYKVQQNGEYTNKVVMFMNKLGGSPVQQIDNANLEARVATLETKVAMLMGKKEASIEKVAQDFGGKVVPQTPTPSGYQEQPPLPPEPKEISVDDIPW